MAQRSRSTGLCLAAAALSLGGCLVARDTPILQRLAHAAAGGVLDVAAWARSRPTVPATADGVDSSSQHGGRDELFAAMEVLLSAVVCSRSTEQSARYRLAKRLIRLLEVFHSATENSSLQRRGVVSPHRTHRDVFMQLAATAPSLAAKLDQIGSLGKLEEMVTAVERQFPSVLLQNAFDDGDDFAATAALRHGLDIALSLIDDPPQLCDGQARRRFDRQRVRLQQAVAQLDGGAVAWWSAKSVSEFVNCLTQVQAATRLHGDGSFGSVGWVVAELLETLSLHCLRGGASQQRDFVNTTYDSACSLQRTRVDGGRAVGPAASVLPDASPLVGAIGDSQRSFFPAAPPPQQRRWQQRAMPSSLATPLPPSFSDSDVSTGRATIPNPMGQISATALATVLSEGGQDGQEALHTILAHALDVLAALTSSCRYPLPRDRQSGTGERLSEEDASETNQHATPLLRELHNLTARTSCLLAKNDSLTSSLSLNYFGVDMLQIASLLSDVEHLDPTACCLDFGPMRHQAIVAMLHAAVASLEVASSGSGGGRIASPGALDE